jgi:hypothetical protein
MGLGEKILFGMHWICQVQNRYNRRARVNVIMILLVSIRLEIRFAAHLVASRGVPSSIELIILISV